MTPLARIIGAEIAAGGPISVARFMALALAHPEHGYYMTRDPLGTGGDFTTAPEISQIFGELAGLWAVAAWEGMGRPDPFILAELGPGRGTLMADALRAAGLRPAFVQAARLHLVETSPPLKAAQAERLAAHRPVWVDSVAQLPDAPLIVLANEFFDALPVRQFVRRGGQWVERLVDGTAEKGFFLVEAPAPAADPAIRDADFNGQQIAEGAIAEHAPAALGIIAEIARHMARHRGAGLVFDYGHARRGTGETLQAVRRHAFADPLADPGKADLTAHVDFSALARAAADAGARPFGPVEQGPFLLGLGAAERLSRLCAGKPPESRIALESGLHRLIAPSKMGILFKVLGIAAGIGPGLPGFAAAGPMPSGRES